MHVLLRGSPLFDGVLRIAGELLEVLPHDLQEMEYPCLPDRVTIAPPREAGTIKTPTIPIYIAGVNPYLCRLAGELCQGFHVHPLHTARYLKEIIIPNIVDIRGNDAVQTGDSSSIRSDYADGMRTFEVTYACQLSADRGQEIRLGSGEY